MSKSGFPQTFPVIETPRLILRDISQEDAAEIFKNFSDPDIAKWFFEEPFTEIGQVDQIIAEFQGDFLRKTGLTWAMILKENSTCIGTCGYGDVEINNRGEIGFDLAKEHWGKGLMGEGLTSIIEYGFKALDLTSVEAHTYSNNSRAIALLKKLGFHLDDTNEDSSYFTLSRESWRCPKP